MGTTKNKLREEINLTTKRIILVLKPNVVKSDKIIKNIETSIWGIEKSRTTKIAISKSNIKFQKL